MITLSWLDLALAAIIVMALAGLTGLLGLLTVSRQLVVAALRTTLQLLLLAWILKWLFAQNNPVWVAVISLFMLLVATYEIMGRQRLRFVGWQSFGIGGTAIFVSSFSLSLFTLLILIRAEPWYTPQYAIPLLGMVLGNTMNGVALGLDQLTRSAWEQRHQIEARLMLGHTWQQTIADIRRDSIRSGMIPIMNAMTVAGVVSLPGMMTGQILAGSPPLEAVKYQILIMFLIAAGTGFGTVTAVYLGAGRLFDERHRLCLWRLAK